MQNSKLFKLTLTSFVVLCAMASVGCQSAPPVRPQVEQEPPLQPPPAWMMEAPAEQTFTQRLLKLLSPSQPTPTDNDSN